MKSGLAGIVVVAALAMPAAAATEKRLDGGPRRAVVKSSEPTVSIDVKDAEAGEILKSLQKQCGVRNLMIDPDVKKAKGTFYFYEVPCRQAWAVVLRSMGLESVVYSSSVVTVGTQNR